MMTITKTFDISITLKDICRTYPYNLYAVLLKIGTREDRLTDENIKTILRLDPVALITEVNETLTERESTVINYIYKDGLSQKATGEKLEVTGGRIGQIEKKALRKLHHPSRLNNFQTLSVEEHENNVNQLKADYTRQLFALKDSKENDIKKAIKDNGINPDMDLANINMSIRLYNCLARSGYSNLMQLDGVSWYDVMKIRNMGRNSIDELHRILNSYGFTTKDSHIVWEVE